MHAATRLDAFSQLDDSRGRRGVRHPFSGIVVLMLLGMLARIREMEVLVRWATVHWDQLKGPLGFDRDEPPCATTISRTLAQCQVAEFQAALAAWLQRGLAETPSEGVVAVDGKTAKQGLDDNGRPLHMLNACVHDVQAVVGQWSPGAEETNEPTLLRRHLQELLDAYPKLRLITADAIFAQRPLAELICGKDRDYLLQIEANQGDTLDALQHCFAQAAERRPAAETTERKFLRDRWRDEDRHYTRRSDLSACMAAIDNAALSIHRLRSDPELPVRAAADYIAWSPAIGIEMLRS